MMWKRSRQHLHQAPQMMTVETPEDLSSLQGSSTRDGRCWIADCWEPFQVCKSLASHRIHPLSNHQMESCQEIKKDGIMVKIILLPLIDAPSACLNFNHSGKLTNLRRDQRIIFFYRVIRYSGRVLGFFIMTCTGGEALGHFSMEFYKSFILIKSYSFHSKKNRFNLLMDSYNN